MKKIILIPALLTMFLVANAQQDSVLKSKKGKVILPEKHDFCVGISGNTFFNYLGNFFNQAGTNSLNLGLIGGNSLYGKFYLNTKNAIRLRANLNMFNANYENKYASDTDPSGLTLITDKQNASSSNYGVATGYENRHGAGRLQVLLGLEFLLSNYKTIYKNTYGNPFTANNPNPTTTFFNDGSPGFGRVYNRTLNSNYDSGIGLGARAYFGLEYFIFPKISIGGEFGISGNYFMNGKTTVITESWDFVNRKTLQNKVEYKNNKVNSFTDNLNGQIMLLFYFN